MVADRELLQFFGKRLRAARHAAHFSQAGLARRLQLGQDTISHYEGGQCRPDLTTLARLSEVLGVSINYFFPDADMAAFGEEERETLALLNRLSPTTAHTLFTLIRHCAEAEDCNRLLLEGVTAQEDAERVWQRWLVNELRRLGQETSDVQQPDPMMRLNTVLVVLRGHLRVDLHPRAVQRLNGLLRECLNVYAVKEQS